MQTLAQSVLESLSELEQNLLLGTVIQVQIRIGSRTKTFHIVRADDGLRLLNDYRSETNEASGKLDKPFGIIGATLLHEGVSRGDQITNAIQLDCLPDGSVVEQHQPLLSSTPIVHTKQSGLWRSEFFSYSHMAYSGSHMSGILSSARVIWVK